MAYMATTSVDTYTGNIFLLRYRDGYQLSLCDLRLYAKREKCVALHAETSNYRRGMDGCNNPAHLGIDTLNTIFTRTR